MAPTFQLTRGRMAAKQAQALTPGARVSATLVAVTGPQSQVTGARTTPTNVPDVFERRLAPPGTFTAPENTRLWRCAMAQAGQAMNQTSCAGSPHPHVSAVEGCPAQTCHHRTAAGTVKQASATTWKATVRRPRRIRPRPDGRRGRASTPVSGGDVGSPPRPGPSAMVSAAGCADTSIPLVTAAERTAGPSVARACMARSYDRRRARQPTLHRDRCGPAGSLRRMGAAPAGLADPGPRGGGGAGPRALGLQGRRPNLPSRLSRSALRRDGHPRSWALARPRAGDRPTTPARDRSGDHG